MGRDKERRGENPFCLFDEVWIWRVQRKHMLAYTSHLPPASHRLSVLATQLALITSDMEEQEKEGGRGRGNCRDRVCFWPCVFWVMRYGKAPLFGLLSFLAAPPPSPDYVCDLIFNPFTLSLMQPYMSNRVGCIKEALPQQSVMQSSINSIPASAQLVNWC